MILKGTNLTVYDNSGAKKVQCIGLLGGSERRVSKLGCILRVSVKKLKTGRKVNKKQVYGALITATTKAKRRKKGYSLRFDSNGVLLFSDQDKFLGTRISGPICKEIRSIKTVNLDKQIISYSRLLL